MFTTVDNDRPDAKRCSNTGTDGSPDGSSCHSPDERSRTGRPAQLYRVVFERTLSDSCTFGINPADVIAFDGYGFDHDPTEIAPPIIAEYDPVKRKGEFGPLS